MLQILVVSLFFAIAFTGMGLALHFSKYKKENSGCCGGVNCDIKGSEHSCYKSQINYLDNNVIKAKSIK